MAVPVSDYKEIENGVGINLNDKKSGKIVLEEEQEIDITISKQSGIPVVGLMFGAGIYRTGYHIGILKSLEKHNIPINMLSGAGLGLLVAAMYAKYQSASVVEWRFFKLVQTLRNERSVFSKSWEKSVEDFLKTEFGNDEIEQLKISLIVPYFDSKDGRLKHQYRGPLYPYLASITQLVLYSKSVNESSSIISSAFPLRFMKKRGADIIFVFDVLLPQVNLKTHDSYLKGIFERLVGRVYKEREFINYFFDAQLGTMALDDLDRIQEFITKGEEAGKGISHDLEKIINDWKLKRNKK